jgi:hypothetical protein
LFLDSAATVVNSTFSGNSAVGNPASQFSGVGGGIFVGGQFNPSNVTFINTTIANNSSNVVGGGVASGSIGPSVTVSFVNTLVAGNVAPADMNCGRLSADNWVSLGHNLDEEDNCLFDQPSDQVNTDPLLGPLQDNGGPTLTHALLDLSPAIDAGDDGVCAASPVNGVDQRGVARPIGPHCDTGAYESTAVPPVIIRFVYLPFVTN